MDEGCITRRPARDTAPKARSRNSISLVWLQSGLTELGPAGSRKPTSTSTPELGPPSTPSQHTASIRALRAHAHTDCRTIFFWASHEQPFHRAHTPGWLRFVANTMSSAAVVLTECCMVRWVHANSPDFVIVRPNSVQLARSVAFRDDFGELRTKLVPIWSKSARLRSTPLKTWSKQRPTLNNIAPSSAEVAP